MIRTVDKRLATLLLVGAALVGLIAVVRVMTADRADAAAAAGASPTGLPAPGAIRSLTRQQTPGDLAVADQEADRIALLTERDPDAANSIVIDMRPRTFRVFAHDLGANRQDFYAFERSDGKVCFGLTAGPAGCLAGFPPHFDATYSVVEPDGAGQGAPAYVYGLAADDVRSVTVMIDGEQRTARLEGNAYFFEYPSSAMDVTALSEIDLELADGSSQSTTPW